MRRAKVGSRLRTAAAVINMVAAAIILVVVILYQRELVEAGLEIIEIIETRLAPCPSCEGR